MRYEIDTPLTINNRQARLATHQVERCPALPPRERERLLARLSVIGCATEALATQPHE